MDTLYIITHKSEQAEAIKKTILSLDTKSTYIQLEYSNEISEEQVVSHYIDNLDKEYSHFCIIPAGSTLSENYTSIVTGYLKDREAIYLPIVSYCFEEGSAEEIFKGFLNVFCWKPQHARVIGELTKELALKQVDTTLYGALIPFSVLKTYKLNEKIKYFSQFEYLNRVIKKGVKVLGIPKMLVTLNKDFELKSISKEEKLKYFEQARAEYLS